MWKLAMRKLQQFQVGEAALSRRLRQIAPYVLIELLLPGGTLVALCMYVYRRKRGAFSATAA